MSRSEGAGRTRFADVAAPLALSLAALASPAYVGSLVLLGADYLCQGWLQETILNVVLAFSVLAPPIAVVLAVVSLAKRTSRRRMGWAGLCLGVFGLVFLLIPLSYSCPSPPAL